MKTNCPDEPKTYAVDFETFYTEDYGIEEVGLYHYLHDVRFDPYLVSIYGPDVDYVGRPSDAPWHLINGHVWVSHNAGFDRQVYEAFISLNKNAGRLSMPSAWYCTANLSVYLGGPRSLKEASKVFLGLEMDKGMRNYMRGKTWDEAVADGKAEALMAYARTDSINCLALWTKLESQWPQFERDCAELTYQQTKRGLGVDRELLERTLPPVYEVREAARVRIPWHNDPEEKILSANALKAWLAENKFEVPETTNAKDPRFIKWQAAHAEVDVVKAMQQYRSSNSLFMKGDTLHTRIREDGRFQFDMKYFGATTGRASSGYEDERAEGGGVNVLNLTKEAMFGFDIRRCFKPAEGKKFVIGDFSQIEPRCGAWLTDDQAFLELLRPGKDGKKAIALYEAHARTTMGWKGGDLKKESPKIYALAKARVLALGYQAGWAKFIVMAVMYGCADCLDIEIPDYAKWRKAFERYLTRYEQWDKMVEDPTEKDWIQAVNAWIIVNQFRDDNPRLAGRDGLWKSLERDARRCVGTDYVVELPSGRLLKYFNVRIIGGKLMVQKTLGTPHINVWGGFLTENICQAFARDVLYDRMLALEAAGIQTIFNVYDEIICEVPKAFDLNRVTEIMTTPPSWCSDLPLDISIEEADYYKK